MSNNPLWEMVQCVRKIGMDMKGKELVLSSSLSTAEQSMVLEHYYGADNNERKSPNAEMWV